MLPSFSIIPNEFLFLIEVIKASCYHISYYFFLCTSQHTRCTHSEGLTIIIIVNKDVLLSLFFCYCYMMVKGKSKYITKHLMYGLSGTS